MASALTRTLARRLDNGLQTANARTHLRKAARASIEVTPDEIVVHLGRRALNPLFLQAGYPEIRPTLPWLANRTLRLRFASARNLHAFPGRWQSRLLRRYMTDAPRRDPAGACTTGASSTAACISPPSAPRGQVPSPSSSTPRARSPPGPSRSSGPSSARSRQRLDPRPSSSSRSTPRCRPRPSTRQKISPKRSRSRGGAAPTCGRASNGSTSRA